MLGELADERLALLHGEQDACSASDTLLDSTISHERLKLLAVSFRQAKAARLTASHRIRS
jgi:hypothetical protein